MKLIIDCSVALKWVVKEAGSGEAARLLSEDLYAPDFVYVECTNALWKLAQRGEINADQAAFKLAALRQVKIQTVSMGNLVARALDMACLLRHPVYDCLYIATAEMFSGQMVTVDTKLLRVSAASRFSPLVISLQDAAGN